MKKKMALNNKSPLTRREFVNYASLAVGSLVCPIPGWLAKAEASSNANHTVIVVFLRGAIDPLSVLVPRSNSPERLNYEAARTTESMRIPANQLLSVSGHSNLTLGLHPAGRDLVSLLNNKRMKLVMGCGSPNTTTSHFKQQKMMERGLGETQVSGVSSGMFNRALACVPSKSRNLPAVTLSSVLDQSLQGPQPAVALGSLGADSLSSDLIKSQIPMAERLQETWLKSSPQAPIEWTQRRYAMAAKLAMEALPAVRSTDVDLCPLTGPVDDSVDSATGPDLSKLHYAGSKAMRNAVQLLKADPGLRFVTLSFGSWDTHSGQGTLGGTFERKLRHLGRALRTLNYDLQRNGLSDRTTVVVLSEFGRTVRENASKGTDHGRGGLAMVLGADLGTATPPILSNGFTLASTNSDIQNNVLPVTYDYRNVVAEVLAKKMKIAASSLTGGSASVFPGLVYNPYRILG